MRKSVASIIMNCSEGKDSHCWVRKTGGWRKGIGSALEVEVSSRSKLEGVYYSLASAME